jgi:hypothetical protein
VRVEDQGAQVLGIEVGAPLLARWRDWLMPAEQPYLVPRDVALRAGLADDRERLSFEVTDSFMLYGIGDHAVCWLSRAGSRRLPAEVRRDQPARHRWPSDRFDDDFARIVRFVEEGRRRSRHTDVAETTWRRASDVLPAARDLAGTFPPGSGPNCFGTVMGVAGVAGAAGTWMQREPFEDWLAAETRPGGRDDLPGTVLIWRDAELSVQHAAVTLGDGWALHKPSQGWMSPAKVLTVRDVIFSSRYRGHHLQRRSLVSLDVSPDWAARDLSHADDSAAPLS